jgi:hypothetical protein
MRNAQCHLVSSNPADAGSAFVVPQPLCPVVNGPFNLSGSFSGPPQLTVSMIDLNYQVILSCSSTTNVVTGTVFIEQSNDPTQAYFNSAVSPYGVTNWSTVATQQMSGSGNININLSGQGQAWTRFRWAHLAGTGSMDVYDNFKGHAF